MDTRLPWMRPVAMNAERKSALQGSGLVRTVGLCAQRRVAFVPRAIATARDALIVERLARKRRAFERRDLFFVIILSVSSPVP